MPTIAERIDVLTDLVKAKVSLGIDEKVQKEIARLVLALPTLHKAELSAFVSTAELSASCLLASAPNVELAKELNDQIEHQERRLNSPIRAMMHGGSPAARVTIGLGTLLYFGLPLSMSIWFYTRGVEKILGIDSQLLALVSVAGAIGSVVSIMVRINDFNLAKETDPTVLFLTGFFKPIIGVSFALFIFSVINAGILPLTIKPDGERYFFAALS